MLPIVWPYLKNAVSSQKGIISHLHFGNVISLTTMQREREREFEKANISYFYPFLLDEFFRICMQNCDGLSDIPINKRNEPLHNNEIKNHFLKHTRSSRLFALETAPYFAVWFLFMNEDRFVNRRLKFKPTTRLCLFIAISFSAKCRMRTYCRVNTHIRRSHIVDVYLLEFSVYAIFCFLVTAINLFTLMFM